jgi:hypothetical protein
LIGFQEGLDGVELFGFVRKLLEFYPRTGIRGSFISTKQG